MSETNAERPTTLADTGATVPGEAEGSDYGDVGGDNTAAEEEAGSTE